MAWEDIFTNISSAAVDEYTAQKNADRAVQLAKVKKKNELADTSVSALTQTPWQKYMPLILIGLGLVILLPIILRKR